MFSYRHAFHAGNHADVLKHAVFVHMLAHLAQKDTAFTIVDTHAGAGCYALDGRWASVHHEADLGLARVCRAEAPPPLVAHYLQALGPRAAAGTLRRYPGSPSLAWRAMRPQDQLVLFELHPTEITVLRKTMQGLQRQNPVHRRVQIEHADGFANLARCLPPPSRRGLVLIDPPYEDKHDYRRVVQTTRSALQRFAQACMLIWYPQVSRLGAQELPRALAKLPAPWLHATLRVRKPATDGLGMHGCGVFVFNPPWTLADQLRTALPWLTQVLAQDEHAEWQLTEGPADASAPPAPRGPRTGRRARPARRRTTER